MKSQFFCIFFLALLFSSLASAADIPSNVTLTATKTSIKVDWNGDTEADGYYVYYGTSSGSLDQQITVDDSKTEYTINDLESGTTYYVAVSSYENSNESGRSAVKSISTLEDTGIPETPTGFSATGKNGIGQNFVSLKWDKNTESDLDHYTLYYGTTSGVYGTTIEVTDPDAASYTVTGLSGSVRYYFSITASDTSNNESEKSDPLIVDTLVDNRSPNPPQGVSGALSGVDSVTVSVVNGNSRMADFSGTIIYYGAQSNNLTETLDLGSSFSHEFEDLPVGSVWYFSASAYDFSGNESVRTGEGSVLVEATERFLNQPDDFDGGCFISASSPGSRFPMTFFIIMGAAGLMVSGARRFIMNSRHVLFTAAFLVAAMAGVSYAETADLPEMPGNNIIGVSVGYFIPNEHEFEEYYGEDIYPVYAFYERFLTRYVSADLEGGFMKEKGRLLTVSGAQTLVQTKYTLAPVSASVNLNWKLMSHVVGYIGVGPDYWYCQEETDEEIQHPEIEEWVGGFHGKIGVRLYNTDEKFKGTGALIESRYSQIDRFSDNKTDIGGWAFKFGLFWHF